jgi:hypothetical protein
MGIPEQNIYLHHLSYSKINETRLFISSHLVPVLMPLPLISLNLPFISAFLNPVYGINSSCWGKTDPFW